MVKLNITYTPKQLECRKALEEFPVVFFGGARGGGKASSVNSLVSTPFGFKRMGDIKVGDAIHNPMGTVQQVIAVHPQGVKPIYEVEFIDGARTRVTGDHLWLVRKTLAKYKADWGYRLGSREHEGKILTTLDIKSFLESDSRRDGQNLLIPLTEPLQFTQARRVELPIDPYALGALIGNGYLAGSGVSFSTPFQCVAERMESVGVCLTEYADKANCFSFGVPGIKDRLAALELTGLANSKFIPENYKTASIDERIDLVRGLMDTDGYVDSRGHMIYTTVSKRLAEDFQWVIRSLGGKATIADKDPVYTYKGDKLNGQKAYNVYFQTPINEQLVTVPFKRERIRVYNGGCSELQRRIVSVKQCGEEEAQCITVNHPNGLYVTDDFIVTHNSRLARNIALEWAYRYPGITIAIFRRSFPEITDNHIRPMMTENPFLRDFYIGGRKQIELDNGSMILFRFCDTEDDLKKYQGLEVQLLIIDEATNIPEEWLIRLRASNRTSIPGIPVRTLYCGNPGGVSHSYFKRLFVDRSYNPEEVQSDYCFIQSFIKDNAPLMKADPNYRKRLEAEPNEAIRRAWLDGDWDIFAGRAFPEFRKDVHVVEPFDIPPTWRKVGALDWGFSHPACFLWAAVDPQKRVYIYREYVTRKERPDEILQRVFEWSDTRELREVIAGHDCFSKQKDGGPTIAEQFLRGLDGDKRFRNMLQCDYNRVQGWNQLRLYLAHENLPEGVSGPRLFIFKGCRHLIEAIPRMQFDKRNIEDVMKVDCGENHSLGSGDDQVDALRYLLMSRPLPGLLPQQKPNQDRWERRRRQRAAQGGGNAWAL